MTQGEPPQIQAGSQTDGETPVVAAASAAPSPERLSAGRAVARVVAGVAFAIVSVPALLSIFYVPGFAHPVSMPMLARYLKGEPVDRRWTPLERIAPGLVAAVVMSEDGRFCSHFGVDPVELNAVIGDVLEGETPRGASTIPMQTVKNLFLPNDRSLLRKAVEMPLAVYFDRMVPKRRTLEIYLNVAEWGEGVFGAEAAARRHFGVPAAALTSRQAALLAAALPNPRLRNPARPGAGMARIAGRIESRAAKSGGYLDCVFARR